MGGRSKISNWAWMGSGFIVSSILSFIKLLYTGSGFGPRFGHDLRGELLFCSALSSSFSGCFYFSYGRR